MLRRVALVLAAMAAIGLAFPLLVRFRGKSVARFNRAVTNRIARRFAGRARGFGLIVHRGRTTGRVYRTPVNVFKVPEGFLIVLTYGRGSEWVKNVLAAGGCTLKTRGLVYRLSNPVIVEDPRARLLPLPVRVVLMLAGVTDYLRLSASEAAPNLAVSGRAADGRAALPLIDPAVEEHH